MRWGYGEHSVGCGCCLQRGAGGHGEPRGAGEAGGRLSSEAGGVRNARTQLLARSPGAGERPGGKKKNEQNTKTGATEGGQDGEGRLWRPQVLSSCVGKARGAPKIERFAHPKQLKARS